MENDVYGAARTFPVEYLDRAPVALHHAIQEVTRNLVDKVICELEKGESICSLSTVEQIQAVDLYSVEIRRTVNIKRLVRYKECKWQKKGTCSNPRFGNGYGYYPPPPVGEDFFCGDGEKEAQE